MSNPFEVNSQNDVENEARKTVDSSWDSPFHTLGKGATQAAAGNHNHPENLTSDELIAGNNMAIQKNADGSVTISSTLPGATETQHGSLAGRSTADQHPVGAITGLQTALNAKSDTSHGHTGYATTGHNHSGVYAPNSHAHDYAATGHNHSGVYAAASHTHSYGPYFRYGRPSTAFSIGADASTGEIVIPHGLGRVPYAVFVSADDDGGDCTVFASVNRFDATNIVAKMRNIGSIENHVYINWIAF